MISRTAVYQRLLANTAHLQAATGLYIVRRKLVCWHLHRDEAAIFDAARKRTPQDTPHELVGHQQAADNRTINAIGTSFDLIIISIAPAEVN